MMAAMPSPEAVLDTLDPEQRAAAEAVSGPVCVLAGAGTGKTRAITHRIAYAVLSGAVPPSQVLAVTFTARAAGELRGRLRELGAPTVQARTFHAAALRQLTYFWPRAVGGEPPQIIDSKISLVADAARSCGLGLDRAELRDAASEIEWAKVTQTRPDGYVAAAREANRTPPIDAADVARLYDAYETLRRERHLLDFEGMLELTAAILNEYRDVAAEVRDRYRYFVVDEYQDVNPLQKLLLDTWLADRRDVCVVGDPNQTIYSFTGASPRYLLDFALDFPEATQVRLVRDYRSTPQIVEVANTVLAGASGPARQHRIELAAQRADGPSPAFTAYDDEEAEAAGVARRARELVNAGVPAREIAVLFRTNGQSETYEQALAQAEVPYVVRGGERFFDRPEVRKALLLLRGSVRSYDGETGDVDLVTAVRHVLSGAGLSAQPPAGGAAREQWESLSAIVRLADNLTATGSVAGMEGFVAELTERAANRHAPPVEGVTLASLHAAKGLEWDAVFLVGAVDGMLPIAYAQTPTQVEEERRLFYVGVTRARHRLAVSWALARAPGSRRGRRPSRFLDDLRPDTDRHGAAAGTASGQQGKRGERHRERARPVPCRVCGRSLTAAAEQKLGRCTSCPADLDEALFASLREWRLETSRTEKVPAFVIFTDATLQAIAEQRPTDERELLAIPGVGQAKLERYGAAVLDLCTREKDGGVLSQSRNGAEDVWR